MPPLPIEHEELRLEPPFYLAHALAAARIPAGSIEASRFADDAVAAALNEALRASIESVFVNEVKEL